MLISISSFMQYLGPLLEGRKVNASRQMLLLWLLLALQGVLIGGHMGKSNVHHGIGSKEQVITNKANIYDEKNLSHQDFLTSIAFHPPSVDFGTWSIGTAQSYLVTLINKNANKSVHLSSISGNTQEFFSSFFEDKVVPPHGNTTFNVVFLPRSVGPVETDLFIHTSFGQARLLVRGEGRECPYQIKSLVGIKAPFNATITPEIYIYNPHAQPLQILEIYSSGGQFQLELPSGGQEGPQALWEIPPYATKPIIRIRFHGIQAGNHTAFIRIKISVQDETPGEGKDANILVVPVEIEISEQTGLYSSNPVMDFGKVTTMDEEKVLRINLINSGEHTYQGLEYHVKDTNGLIVFDKSDLTLHLNPLSASDNVKINGVLSVQMWRYENSNSESKKYFELPISLRAEIFKGSLDFEANRTVFVTGAKNYTNEPRNFTIHNRFSVPIIVVNVTAENSDMNVFRIENFTPVTIRPDETATIFRITALNADANFRTQMRIETNLSNYQAPIVVCTGNLERYTSLDQTHLTPLPETSVLNFGAVQHQDTSDYGYIVLRNFNPIAVGLLNWNFTTSDHFTTRFLGCAASVELAIDQQTDEKHETLSLLKDRFRPCSDIKQNDVAVFQLCVQSLSVKQFSGVFRILTEYEEIVTTVNFAVVMGRLEVDLNKLHFADCFPGKRCSADISIQSTFVKNMHVNSITVSVPGLVFEYHTRSGLPEIVANSVTDIGRIHFDPKSVCGKLCYIMPDDENETSAPATLDFDELELRRRTELFRRFKYTLQMIKFTLSTSKVKFYTFNSTVDMIWPKLVSGHQVLPIIEVGQNYDGNIIMANPSNHNLQVEMELADPRQAKSMRLSLPLEVIENCAYCYLTDENVFSIGHEDGRKVKLNIKAKSVESIPIRFIGSTAGQFSTLLHIHNNLTLYEAVWITGKAIQPQLRFGNRKPGSTTPLLFEMSEKHLAACDRSDDDGAEPRQVATKRTFTARNTGEVPILIEKFFIKDRECEGYGFKILDCFTFQLNANSSQKVAIAFTPDFTMTRIAQTLVIVTNLSSAVNYTLLATVPSSVLHTCSKSLPRPHWEYLLKILSIFTLVVAYFLAFNCSFTEIYPESISKAKGPVQPPLDLRAIGLNQTQFDEIEDSTVDEPLRNLSFVKIQRWRELEAINAANDDSDGEIVNRNVFAYPDNRKLRSRRPRRRKVASSVPSSEAKEKPWNDEMAKKVYDRSSASSSPKSSPKSSILVKAIQAVSSSAASVAEALTKHTKNEKVSTSAVPMAAVKKVSDTSKAAQHGQSELAEKKTSSKSDLSPPITEAKRQKHVLRRSNIASNDSVKDFEPSLSTPTSNCPEERSSPCKSTTSYEKSMSGQQEKISVEILSEASSGATSKQSSPTTNERRISPSRSSLPRNFGKTPGRERKKEPSTQHSQRKQLKLKDNAFRFTAPLEGSSSSSSSPLTPSTSTLPPPTSSDSDVWKSKTFSKVVAQESPSKADPAAQYYSEYNAKLPFKQLLENSSSNLDWNQADLPYGLETEENPNPNLIGAIGSKESLATAAVWELLTSSQIQQPMASSQIQRPMASRPIQRPTASFAPQSGNASFFSSDFPVGGTFNHTNQYLENQHFGSVPSNDPRLAWLQQEHIRQQASDWTTNRTWTPMGYQTNPICPAPSIRTQDFTYGDVSTSPSTAHQQMWQPYMPSNTSYMHTTESTNIPAPSNVWQHTQAVVRPPPGHPLRSNGGSPAHRQQLQTQLTQSGLPYQGPQQPHCDLTSNQIGPSHSYHSYASFNSIWTDSWGREQHQ